MEGWTLHWLEASGSLAELKPALVGEFEAAHRSLAALLDPPRLDILVQRRRGEVIREIGLLGRAYRDTLFSLTVDPDNSNFASSLIDGAVRRQILHEVHHCLRMGGPGYGRTLGEALVSEGLAGRFVEWLMDSPPEPWERAITLGTLRAAPVQATVLASATYNHAAWFFGSGEHPRWLGYTLGYEMVGCWLSEAVEVDGSNWVNVPATTVIQAAKRGGLVV
jgi:hypothetical protein